MNPYSFYIDIVGSCNLRCPSCPVGNYAPSNPKGFMDFALFEQIVQKAKSECEVHAICLYNWTEPLLHPKLPDMIRLLNKNGILSYVSSNLNVLKNAEEILAAEPHSFRISVSGFNQSTYGVTHRGGDIEKVKSNMRVLSEAKRTTHSKTIIHVFYHRYYGNLDEEVLMRKYAASLGFEFETGWAFMMPLEKTLAYVSDDFREITLSEDDREIISKLPLNPKQASAAALKYAHKQCQLIGEYLAIDYKGNVQLCCAVYDSSKFTIANFLEMPLTEIQQMRSTNSYCTKCTQHGMHIYATYGAPEFDEIASTNIENYYQQTEIFVKHSEVASEPEPSFPDALPVGSSFGSRVKNHLKEALRSARTRLPYS